MTLQPQVPAVAPLYAGFWRRAAAACLDSLVLIVPAVIIEMGAGQAGMLAFLINVAVGCAYYASFHSSARQATPGKRAFGIKVTDRAGARIGLGRGVGRYFATWLSAFILGIGFLMAAFTQRKQALHDMVSGTLVVNGKADPEEVVSGGGTMPLTGGVIAIIAILFIVPFLGGILAAIAIPAYSDYTVRSKVVSVLNAGSVVKGDVAQAYAEKRPFTTGVVNAPSPYSQSITVTPNGEILMRLVPEVGNGGTIVYSPTIDPAGAMAWQCSSADVPKKYLPAACR
jgi:uncharacterized RDD family membrane protein YckC